jgi:hypothetical protein
MMYDETTEEDVTIDNPFTDSVDSFELTYAEILEDTLDEWVEDDGFDPWLAIAKHAAKEYRELPDFEDDPAAILSELANHSRALTEAEMIGAAADVIKNFGESGTIVASVLNTVQFYVMATGPLFTEFSRAMHDVADEAFAAEMQAEDALEEEILAEELAEEGIELVDDFIFTQNPVVSVLREGGDIDFNEIELGV